MNIAELKKIAFSEIEKAKNPEDLEKARKTYLGRKGELTAVLRSLAERPAEEKIRVGKEANRLKSELEALFESKKTAFEKELLAAAAKKERIDITAPGKKVSRGSSHPLSRLRKEAEDIFGSLGFEIIEGPEVETEYYNFDALNIPAEHPAREMWDTFWLGKKFLMRTHTSPVQIRYMEKHNPPFRIIAPGRVFRHEATDASHEIQFNQLEGLMVGKDVSLADLKGILEQFLRRLMGEKIQIRFKPSYFPFVEPGVEVDMLWNGRWLEMLGAGMVHPNVLRAGGLNPNEWQGFAFGVGIDRLAMLKYKIDDIRLFYSGDLRFLRQF
ncbi:phenylalanine--tRNA ligase subunit alpha [Candidatus Azambacteria bacterium RIFCSPLOWO2_01_FULL_46_26]|uniref:Phenylalanine--tRNA ligase alpha subunit n=2 Tax=Candidatus Azamiibacteriota TaxID=1752741 RepID=A0A1F5C8V6_9BACT|nr:MAG: phenylalanine--tRNA ligase subunit alpha [Candidatus Azambacteria bacterium RIFCSPHIGHO2_02_46_12]OGD39301.1 MAG: phenylalanine--tRNA ligase subunit alpha [Candidatus Azambacteria bacterium RIFCSPLOWO2_01_FULL_46_26]